MHRRVFGFFPSSPGTIESIEKNEVFVNTLRVQTAIDFIWNEVLPTSALRCVDIYRPIVCRDLILWSLTFISAAAVCTDSSHLSFSSYFFCLLQAKQIRSRQHRAQPVFL